MTTAPAPAAASPAAASTRRTTSRAAAVDFLAARRLVVLTGAGISTDSGIPDYRGPNSPARLPMTYQEFCSGPDAQRRYWARSHVGWARMGRAEPNAGHRDLARVQALGGVDLLITQNVDGLHEAAGSAVVALHGRISDVVCLSCRAVTSRRALQEELARLNPGYAAAHRDAAARPDGDVELNDTADFEVPACGCGGVLKPDVVFFGENVPAPRVQRCYDAVDALATQAAAALLVVGSSLTVMSGLRFVKRAAKAGTPVVVVNRGTTRGDDLATHLVDDGCSEFLAALAAS